MSPRALTPAILSITRQQLRDSVDVVVLAGELDMATAPSLTQTLDGIDHATTIILDLSKLSFIDSHGVRALLARAGADRLVVLRPSDHIRRVLALTCADRVLTIRETLEDALATFERRDADALDLPTVV
jgi:anti-anti-sigma factor